jgi:hypothetical protein
MAARVDVSLTSVQRICSAHCLQPHRLRTFKSSNDPQFAAKVEDIVGLYMDPPVHAVVVSNDDKSQIQALDRAQSELPLKPSAIPSFFQKPKCNWRLAFRHSKSRTTSPKSEVWASLSAKTTQPQHQFGTFALSGRVRQGQKVSKLGRFQNEGIPEA